MYASHLSIGVDLQAGSLEDACKALLEKGYAVVALNPKQNFWDPVRKTQLVYPPPTHVDCSRS